MRSLTLTAILAVSAAAAFGAAAVAPDDSAPRSQLAAGTDQKIAAAPAADAVSRIQAAATPAVAAAGPPQVQTADYAPRFRDGRYSGPAVDAYYGLVQVQAVIQRGRIVAIDVLRYPSDRATSRSINARALPALRREVIRAQSANVHAVSGATLTSRGFLRSTYDALRQAQG